MFDLAAYLARIALKTPPAADADGLATLQRAHRLAIPFENFDVLLGRGVAIDVDAVVAKLVDARRGGYCFEHDALFRAALEALGFVARPLLARVWLGQPHAVPPRTHTLSLVTIDGRDRIADAGFGGSYAPPMPLAEDEEAEAPDGARFRLARDPLHGWMLSRLGPVESTDGRAIGGGWQPQYSFTEEPVFPADIALSNHWVATASASRFTQGVVVSLPLPQGFARLNGRDYARSAAGGATAARIDDPRVYRMRLSLLFGIDLTAEEVAALGLFAAA